MTSTGVNNDTLLALLKAVTKAQIAAGSSAAGGYVKAKSPSFSGKQNNWPLFKMQLLAYLSTLGLVEVLEELFDKELPAKQDTV